VRCSLRHRATLRLTAAVIRIGRARAPPDTQCTNRSIPVTLKLPNAPHRAVLCAIAAPQNLSFHGAGVRLRLGDESAPPGDRRER
jgi:hypothetical protein